MKVAKIYVRVKTNKEKQNTVEKKTKKSIVESVIWPGTTKGRVVGSSLSYPAAQNITQQDLFGGHYDEAFFTEPKSRIPLERLHKTTTKTEMNEDSPKKKKQKKRKKKG